MKKATVLVIFCLVNLFYFICFSDPPLEESDIPAGQWLCHRCRIRERRVSYHSILTLTTYPLPPSILSLWTLTYIQYLLQPGSFPQSPTSLTVGA